MDDVERNNPVCIPLKTLTCIGFILILSIASCMWQAEVIFEKLSSFFVCCPFKSYKLFCETQI